MTVAGCDGLRASPGGLFAAALRGPRAARPWLFVDGREVVYTFQGRNAIALFCRLVGLGPGDEVLAPAFNCGAEIDPYVCAGAKVVLYDVDRGLGIDVDRIARAMTPRTRVLHVTHFFGAAQTVEPFVPECRKRGVRLLEDCAQALYSSAPGGPVGMAGDCAVYSFVKSLPAPDGGALVIGPGLAGPGVRLITPPLPWSCATASRWSSDGR